MSKDDSGVSKREVIENLKNLLEYARRRHEGITNMLASYDEKLKKYLTVSAFIFVALAFVFKILVSDDTELHNAQKATILVFGILAVVFVGIAFVTIVRSLRPETYGFPGMPPISKLVDSGEFDKISRVEVLEGLISNYTEATEDTLRIQKARGISSSIILIGLIGGAVLTGLVMILIVFAC